MPCSIAVIPAAGLGTRLRPLTYYIAKELLPLGTKPTLDYVMAELAECEIKDVVLVTSKSKKPHFEFYISETKRTYGISCHIALQESPLGLGHAVLCAKDVVGNQQFAVVLPDDILVGENATMKLIEASESQGGSAILSMRVDPDDVEKYGIIKTQSDGNFVESLIEKPKKEEAPSNLAIVGRYCFSPLLWQKLDEGLERKLSTGDSKELDLTIPMNALIEDGHRIAAVEFGGTRYDTGNMKGYIRAFRELSVLLLSSPLD
jgi:UTP--glucose-1-phosphate uridylyltransferase